MGDKSLEMPFYASLSTGNLGVDKSAEIFPELTKDSSSLTDQVEHNIKGLDLNDSKLETCAALSDISKEQDDSTTNKIDHEKILEESFLCAIKFKSKEFKLPIIVSTFMKIMQTCCPSGFQFDLKQTRFKKISLFLKEMEEKGCIKNKELQKGVLSITSIQTEHEMIKFFKKPEWFKILGEIQVNEQLQNDDKFVFEVVEMFKVDGNTEAFFKTDLGKKGTVVGSSEIRQSVTNYIKERQLQLPDNQRCFKPDELMTRSFLKNKLTEKLTFEELFSIIFGNLPPMHQIKKTFSAEKKEVIYEIKGKFQPVEFKMENRGGNKKVTCIYNLSAFDLDPNGLQSRIKNKLGCSVTIVEAPVAGASASQNFIICVQGNQIYPVSEILNSEFGIQIKYMQGLNAGIKK
jgi:translation initiation factor 2D